jgi:hypothetical protein
MDQRDADGFGTDANDPWADAHAEDGGAPLEPTGTHPAAVWGFVLSLLPTCLTQLVAIPLAIVALVRINASGGRRGGQGLAIAALVISPVVLLGLACVALPLAAIAIPGVMRSRVGANESMAIGALRSLATAQAVFQAQTIVDQDEDGLGEYGTLGELAGLAPCRGSGAQMNQSPFIASILGVRDENGVAQKSGYHFVVYLPTATGPARREGNAESPTQAGDADAQEARWCAYAWPVSPGQSGHRVFFVKQEGEVWQARASVTPYGGRGAIPAPAAAYDRAGPAPANLDGPVAVAAQSGDGNTWLPAGN